MKKVPLIITVLFILFGLSVWPSSVSAQEEDSFIMGPAQLTMEQCVAYIKHRNAEPKINCSVEELVGYYYQEAGLEGIRPDVALCQAILETNCFAFGKDVIPAQNNYCGLGTTGNGVQGAYFMTPQMGVRAHIQHLLAYCSDHDPKTPVVDPRFSLIRAIASKYNQCPTWESLDGNWAVPGNQYGENILKTYELMKNMMPNQFMNRTKTKNTIDIVKSRYHVGYDIKK